MKKGLAEWFSSKFTLYGQSFDYSTPYFFSMISFLSNLFYFNKLRLRLFIIRLYRFIFLYFYFLRYSASPAEG